MDSKAREFVDEQVVVLSYVLAHTVNLGFQDIRNARLESLVVRGQKVRVRNLRHLADLLAESSAERYLRFELSTRGAGLLPRVVILERSAVEEAEAELLRRNKIPAARRLGQ